MQDWIARRDACRYIAVTGMHGVTEAKHDPQLHAALASASLVVPDGMPLVWLGRRRGFALPRRVYRPARPAAFRRERPRLPMRARRSEKPPSELQSPHPHLCRLL